MAKKDNRSKKRNEKKKYCGPAAPLDILVLPSVGRPGLPPPPPALHPHPASAATPPIDLDAP